MKVYIETLGCPKNSNDSQVAAGLLEAEGFVISDTPDDADVLMLNTCGFINDAKLESIERIIQLGEYEDRILLVSGCLSKRYVDELFEEMPEVDIFIGVNEYGQLADILRNAQKGRRQIFVGEYEKELETEKRKLDAVHHYATIKISEGCDNFCSYCIIPFIRGEYRSRPMENIVAEAERLAAEGVREIILIGQDVAMYGSDLYGRLNLHELVRKIAEISGIEWIRLMYCYEDKITDELIETIAEEEKVCNYIDIPIQHISDSVLENMNRRSTSASVRKTIEKLKSAVPDIAIRTTLITGFPGESDSDFDELYDFVQDTEFARLGVFAYSQEEGTAAAEMKNQIPEDIREQRRDAIMRAQMLISRANNEKLVGKILDVIIDEKDPDEGVYIGRSRYDAPDIDNQIIIQTASEHQPGDIIRVEIVDAYDYDCVGREITEDESTK